MVIPIIYYAYFCAKLFCPMAKKAIIVGASGLIGSKLLDILTAKHDYTEIVSVSRRKKRTADNRRLTQVIINFNHLADHADVIKGDVLFCCLGTTKNKTPDPAEYRKIDHDYAVQLAQIAMRNGIKQFHLVSSLGANERSSSFYLKLKGETEADIIKVGLESLHIYQPSLLTGNRKKPGLGERIATLVFKLINPLLFGGLAKYKSIPATTVAIGMYKQSLKSTPGVFTYTSDIIKQL